MCFSFARSLSFSLKNTGNPLKAFGPIALARQYREDYRRTGSTLMTLIQDPGSVWPCFAVFGSTSSASALGGWCRGVGTHFQSGISLSWRLIGTSTSGPKPHVGEDEMGHSRMQQRGLLRHFFIKCAALFTVTVSNRKNTWSHQVPSPPLFPFHHLRSDRGCC